MSTSDRYWLFSERRKRDIPRFGEVRPVVEMYRRKLPARPNYDIQSSKATIDDAEAFSPLLASLGYPSDPSSLRTRIPVILENTDVVLLVATSESSDKSLGLLSMHFIPQLGLEGDVAPLGFLVVDENCHGSGIGKLLEPHAENLTRERGCDKMVIRLLGGSADL